MFKDGKRECNTTLQSFLKINSAIFLFRGPTAGYSRPEHVFKYAVFGMQDL